MQNTQNALAESLYKVLHGVAFFVRELDCCYPNSMNEKQRLSFVVAAMPR
jgi:hypothetical protein